MFRGGHHYWRRWWYYIGIFSGQQRQWWSVRLLVHVHEAHKVICYDVLSLTMGYVLRRPGLQGLSLAHFVSKGLSRVEWLAGPNLHIDLIWFQNVVTTQWSEKDCHTTLMTWIQHQGVALFPSTSWGFVDCTLWKDKVKVEAGLECGCPASEPDPLNTAYRITFL